MASFGSPEQFLIGSLGTRLGAALPGVGSSLAQALVAGGRGLSGYLGQGGAQAPVNQGPNTFMPSWDYDQNSYQGLVQASQYGGGGDVGAGGPGDVYGQQAGAAAKPDQTQKLIMQRAMEDAENRRALIQARKWGAVGGSPGRGAINSNFYSGLGLDVNGLFNSPDSPYGQLQHSLNVQAPYRAQERVALIEAQTAREANRERARTANRLVDAILSGQGGMGGSSIPLSGVKTDYGAGVQLSPIFMRSDLSRFRRGKTR